jgi:Mg-chelatase subunit ChlD
MNPDSPINPRSALESSLTALLLGELPHEEAAALHQKLAQDAELAALYERLKHTIGLVRETISSPAQQAADQPAPLKLSEARRQKLLQHFKTVAPREFAKPRRHRMLTLVEIGAAAALVLLLASLLLPAFSKAKFKGTHSFGMMPSLSLDAESARMARGAARAKRADEYISLNGRTERFGIATTPPAQPVPPPAQSAGTAIVLPSDELGETTTQPSAKQSEISAVDSGVFGPEGKLPPTAPNKASFVTRYAYTVQPPAPDGGVSAGTSPEHSDVHNAAPQDISGALQDLFQRSNARQQNQNQSAMLGQSSPLYRHETGNAQPAPGGTIAGSGASGGASGGGFGGTQRQYPNGTPTGDAFFTTDPETRRSVTIADEDTAKYLSQVLTNASSAAAAKGRQTEVPASFSFFTQPEAVRTLEAGKMVKNEGQIQTLGGTGDGSVAAGGPDFGVGEGLSYKKGAGGPENAWVRNFTVSAEEAIPATPSAGPGTLLFANSRLSLPSRPSAETRKGAELLREPAVAEAQPSESGSALAYPTGRFPGQPGNLLAGNGQMQAQGGTAPPSAQETAVNEAVGRQDQLLTSGLRMADTSGHQKQGNVSFSAQGETAPAQRGESSPRTAGHALLGPPEQKALGFNWYLGDMVAANGQIKAQGGTAPPDATGSDASKKGHDTTVAAGNVAPLTGSTDLGYALNADTRPLPGLSNSDGTQVPVLGDVPAAGRFYRHKEDEVGGGGRVKDEEKAGTYDRYAGARFLSQLGEENKDAQGKQRPPIALPSAEPELKLALKDTSGADQNSRQVPKAKQTLEELEQLKASGTPQSDVTPAKPATPAPVPQPEVQTSDNAFSTFSLNVSDVSFKLAAASLEKGVMPEPANVRSEEFINAFDYRDPEAPPGVAVGFAWERAQYPFAQNRDLLRFSIKTAAQGREPGRPMNIVLLLDTSGSMERADRVQIIREALRVLAGQLQPQDKLSIVTFARTARLWADGVPGAQAAQVVEEVSGITPQGGTNLEDAMNLAYATALRHYLAGGINRVVLLTDGAANLGDVEPETLKQKVEANRKQGIALDCFGVGWEGYNDDLLEVLSRNGDGRYGFINAPEEAATEFAGQLAGALHVAASDVKAQIEFNRARVTAYRQIGYAKHQLTKEQFRDNTVAAAQIGAAESGNALYVIAVNPAGSGPLATVRVRYRVPGTSEVHEHEWPVPYTGNAVPLDQSSPAMRLAATASAFSEWLASSPYAGEVTPDHLLGYLTGVPEVYGADARPKKLEWMIRQAKSIAGK